MSDFVKFWSLFPKGRAFAFRDPVYAGGWHRGQDIPGAVIGASWGGKNVPLLRPGTLYYRGYKTKIGYVWVYKVGDEFDTYCHTMATGSKTFRLAWWGEKTGSSWGGPHLHFVRSKTWDAAWNTNRAVMDPRPIIQNYLANASVSKPPVVVKPKPEPEKPPVVVPPEVLEITMSATPFIATVKTDRGPNKQFLVQPNPLAASNPKVKPFIAMGWSGDSKDLPVMDATADWIYKYLEILAERINRA